MKILVIRRDNIGDLVCTTPMIATLSKEFPDAKIFALVNDYNVDVLAGHPLLTRVFAYTKIKHRKDNDSVLSVVFRKIQTYLHLRREKFDYAIVAASGYSNNGIRLAKAAKARHVISYVSEGVKCDPVVDMPVFLKRGLSPRHEVECMAELLTPLGITQEPGPLNLPPAAMPVELKDWVAGEVPVIALHISARQESRVWSKENFCELIADLIAKDFKVLVFWAPGKPDDPRHPGDDEKADYIRNVFSTERTVKFYPTGSVKDLMAAFSCADLAVCSDGGGLHLAAGMGARVVGLFEHLEKKTKHWYPWQVPHRVLTSGSEQDWYVAHIPVQAVVDAIDELMTY